MLTFAFIAEVDGRSLIITGETDADPRALNTGHDLTWGWAPLTVELDDDSHAPLPLEVLTPHLAALDKRALDAAVEQAGRNVAYIYARDASEGRA